MFMSLARAGALFLDEQTTKLTTHTVEHADEVRQRKVETPVKASAPEQ